MGGGDLYVLNGPGLNVDESGLSRWCEEWSHDLNVRIRCLFLADEGALAAATVRAAAEGRGAVLNPGDAIQSEALRDALATSGLDLVWVDINEAERPRPPYLRDITAAAVRGRGVWSYRWATQWLLQRQEWPYSVVSYGPERDQIGDLRLPADGDGPFPVAVLLHGGYWRERWERDTIEPLAIALARRGFASWNLEYRRVGPFGGGWPNTCADVAAGLDALVDLAVDYPLDLDRVAYIGHATGGHLALWAVRRLGVNTIARVRPSLVVSLAGLADLEECARRGLGDTGDAAAELLGGEPEECPTRYAAASPIRALPLGVRQLVVQGRRDNIPDLLDMSRVYVSTARAAGDQVDYLELDDADHFHIIAPDSHAWPPILERIERALKPVNVAPRGDGDANRTALDYPRPAQIVEQLRGAVAKLEREAPAGHIFQPVESGIRWIPRP